MILFTHIFDTHLYRSHSGAFSDSIYMYTSLYMPIQILILIRRPPYSRLITFFNLLTFQPFITTEQFSRNVGKVMSYVLLLFTDAFFLDKHAFYTYQISDLWQTNILLQNVILFIEAMYAIRYYTYHKYSHKRYVPT